MEEFVEEVVEETAEETAEESAEEEGETEELLAVLFLVPTEELVDLLLIIVEAPRMGTRGLREKLSWTR